MRLWIIHKEGIGFAKMVAEIIQYNLEDCIDVSVGNAKKIDPAFLVEEKLDYLIIGDSVSEAIPSLEIQNWLLKYWKISKKTNLIIKAVSGFYVTLADIKIEPFWVEFLKNNISPELIYPPILCLKLNRAELALENGAHDIVKDYSNEFIKYFI